MVVTTQRFDQNALTVFRRMLDSGRSTCSLLEEILEDIFHLPYNSETQGRCQPMLYLPMLNVLSNIFVGEGVGMFTNFILEPRPDSSSHTPCQSPCQCPCSLSLWSIKGGGGVVIIWPNPAVCPYTGLTLRPGKISHTLAATGISNHVVLVTWVRDWLDQVYMQVKMCHITREQGISQDFKMGCPYLLEISKQGVQIIHLQYFYM